ncbi:MAG: hypothetical protein L6Q57_00410 [Alphaproteobacteria bacterium]|nr:hypothetical protein [Alphaproteobacteria bacterium]
MAGDIKIYAIKEPPLFLEKDVRDIINATIKTPKGRTKKISKKPKAKELAKDLNVAYKTYLGWKEGFDQISTRKQISNKLKDGLKKTNKIISTYRELIQTVEETQQIAPSMLTFATEDILNEIIINLEVLGGNLPLLSSKVSNTDHIALNRGGISAETYLKGHILPDLYQRHFNRSAGISYNHDKAGGPMVRFIMACMKHMRLDVKSISIKDSLQIMRKKI